MGARPRTTSSVHKNGALIALLQTLHLVGPRMLNVVPGTSIREVELRTRSEMAPGGFQKIIVNWSRWTKSVEIRAMTVRGRVGCLETLACRDPGHENGPQRITVLVLGICLEGRRAMG
ncbi:hypothetical protein BDV97DRAFT_371842 [Delphinella strobiligena]|nr:hypothetical protein BDV97DRAFT_371842 [Delphinella strobiligena]